MVTKGLEFSQNDQTMSRKGRKSARNTHYVYYCCSSQFLMAIIATVRLWPHAHMPWQACGGQKATFRGASFLPHSFRNWSHSLGLCSKPVTLISSYLSGLSHRIFVKGGFNLFMSMCVFLSEFMCITSVQVPDEARGLVSPRNAVTGSCKLPDMGTGNKTCPLQEQ